MSSIYITSRLHAGWKRSTKHWAAEMRRVCGEEGGFTCMAPRPSQSQPPPEEFASVLQAVLPYVQRGVNAATISAIISGTTATLGGISPSSLLPLAYYGGLSAASFGFEGMCLSYPRDYLGCPFVPLEEFPLSRYFSPSELPNALVPFPTETHNSIVISAARGFNFTPILFTNQSSLRETDLVNVHPRELERTVAPGFLLRNVFGQIRYTGCVRVATDEEIDSLFELLILPDRWVKNSELNLRDFFAQVGIDARVLDEACALTDAGLRASPVASTPSVTDVPARRSRRQLTRDLASQEGISSYAPPISTVPHPTELSAQSVSFSSSNSESPQPVSWHAAPARPFPTRATNVQANTIIAPQVRPVDVFDESDLP